MADYYADSSVLLKRHVREAGTDWFRGLVNPASGNTIITARVSMAEVFSALARRLREARLNPADYARIANDFAAVCAAEYNLVELTPAVIERTRLLLERYPLRAYDAVQLASALRTREALVAAGLPSPAFLAADDRLLDAAQAEGLTADNPNRHS